MAGCSASLLKAITESLSISQDKALILCTSIAEASQSKQGLEDVRGGLNTCLLLFAGALAFFMHAGFASLCAGAIRSKNTLNILLQTVLDACVSAVAFYLLGFGFAYGEGNTPNRFIGNALFGLSSYSTNFSGTGVGRWTDWFFAWAFAATAATIPAGCVAERFNFNAYLGYSAFLASFVYPVVVHWVWSRHGWLNYFSASSAAVRQESDFLFKSGMIDFAGSGVVHMTGALAGLMGCFLVGPRLGRFDAEGRPVVMPGHSAVLSVLGTVMLWFGWYGFNPGSILALDTPAAYTVAARSAVTTTLSGACGGCCALLLGFTLHKSWDLLSLCNGVLVGFVSVTAGAHVLEPWAAMLVGACGAVLFEAACRLLLRLKIDDPLSAFPMHGVCGAWAVLYVGLMAKEEYVQEAYGQAPHYGLFYGGGGRLLACQIIGILAITAWVCGLMGAFFFVFKKLDMLRISPEAEIAGLDVSAHGGSAYNADAGSSHHSGTAGLTPTLRQRPGNMYRGVQFYDAPTSRHTDKPMYSHLHVNVGVGGLLNTGPTQLPDLNHSGHISLASPLVTVIEESPRSEDESGTSSPAPNLQSPPARPPQPPTVSPAAGKAMFGTAAAAAVAALTRQSHSMTRSDGSSSPAGSGVPSKAEASSSATQEQPERSEDSLFSLPMPPADAGTGAAPGKAQEASSASSGSSPPGTNQGSLDPRAAFAGADARACVVPIQSDIHLNGNSCDEPGLQSPARPTLSKQWSQPLEGSQDLETGLGSDSGRRRAHEVLTQRSLQRGASSTSSPSQSPMSGVRFTYFSQRRLSGGHQV